MTIELPKPTDDALAHSKKLEAYIRQAIEQNDGSISFADFMNLALYAPGLGYYSAGSTKFGKAGDFVTAPEISPLFSYCLAKQCAEVLNHLSGADILEFGAGSGKMAADILTKLKSLHSLPQHYYILEVSADLKERQKKYLNQTHPDLIDRIIWLTALPENFTGIVLANEIIDAMPVELFEYDSELKQCTVNIENERFVLKTKTPSDELLSSFDKIKHDIDINAWEQPYQSEINLTQKAWIHSIGNMLKQGLVLLIDYGYSRSQYYHAERKTGTLMCHYQHHTHSDPLTLIGLQDITAHVDFTATAEAAHESHLEIDGFITQANFLLNCGIDEELTLIDDEVDRINQNQAVKKLMLPNKMGETFKVLALSKNYEPLLLGFKQGDISYCL